MPERTDQELLDALFTIALYSGVRVWNLSGDGQPMFVLKIQDVDDDESWPIVGKGESPRAALNDCLDRAARDGVSD